MSARQRSRGRAEQHASGGGGSAGGVTRNFERRGSRTAGGGTSGKFANIGALRSVRNLRGGSSVGGGKVVGLCSAAQSRARGTQQSENGDVFAAGQGWNLPAPCRRQSGSGLGCPASYRWHRWITKPRVGSQWCRRRSIASVHPRRENGQLIPAVATMQPGIKSRLQSGGEIYPGGTPQPICGKRGETQYVEAAL